jgi:hypothetical protein
MSDAPILDLSSTRGQIMLWVTTDPPYSWNERKLVSEFEPMGTDAQTVRGAINGLRGRGLLAPGRLTGKNCEGLKPTGEGFKAVRAHLFGGRVAPARDHTPHRLGDPGPWVWVQEEGWVREDVWEQRHAGGSDE